MIKRILSIITAVFLFASVLGDAALAAETENTAVVLNGKTLNIEVLRKDGKYLLPFKALMNGMGVYAGFDAEKSEYSAEVNEYDAIVPINSDRACYDSVWIELDTPTVEMNGDVAVEIGYIDKIYGIDTETENGTIKISAQIEKKVQNDEEFDVEQYLAGISPRNTPFGEEDLFSAKISDAALISQKEVQVDDAPGFTRAIELENLTEPELYYRSQITMPNKEVISAGDVVYATIYAKKIRCVDESGMSKFDFCIEALDSTWTKFLTEIDQVGDEWTKFTYVFSPSKDVGINGAQLGLRIGFRYQTIQFGGLSIVNYGKNADMALIAPEKVVATTYHGREDGALWREEAFRRIEKYRKNDMYFEVTDEAGNPIKDAKLKADMTKSEFLWGTAINETLAFDWLGISARYQNIVKSEFNSITMENSMKPAQDNVVNRVRSVNFARKNNMYFRAHALLWDAMVHMPENITEDISEEDLRKELKSYASKILYNYGDAITEIDVLNEPLNNHFFMDKYGTDFVAELFKTVKDIDPNVRCFINEIGAGGTSTERLCSLIDELQAKGAPVEGIGLQNHTYSMVYPQSLYNQLDDLTHNLKYAAITEYDYISGLSSRPDALACESDYLRDSIILAYSHPKVTSFTMWGFGDFCHWRGNAPLYTSSYASKPAIKEWEKYVWGEWFTSESAQTDSDGRATIRGHRGDYEITVTVNGKSAKSKFKLTSDGENKIRVTVSDKGINIVPSLLPAEPLKEGLYLDGVYNEENAENEYKQLYQNRAISAAKEDGTDVSFLFDEENDFVCSVNKNSGIVLKTNEDGKNGYVTLRTKDNAEDLFNIESKSRSGEWKRVYAGEAKNGKICVPIESDTAEVRISGLTDVRSLLRYVAVSQKEQRD